MEEKTANQELAHSTNISRILENGTDEEVQMLLGGRDRIRYAGFIRAGRQVPIKDKCTDEEIKLFVKLEAQGLPYDEINRKMGGQPKSKKSKLTMQNTDYFVVRDCDFKKPADAEFIRKNYADADGKVRRIPVFFMNSDINKIIPHGFAAFNGRNQLRCRSFYDSGDKRMKFRYLEPSVTAPKPEDWLVLDSRDPEEATRLCGFEVDFTGMYVVNVKGIKGIGAVVVPTKSWNGIKDGVSVLEKVKERLGRCDGLLNGESMFELVKVEERVQHGDKKVTQQIVTLELAADPMEIEKYNEPFAVAARSVSALQMLTGKGTLGAAAAAPSPQSAPPVSQDSVAEAVDPGSSPEGGAPSPKMQEVLDYLTKLAQSLGFTLDDIRSHYAHRYEGQVLDDSELGELKLYCEQLRHAIKANVDGLKAEIENATLPGELNGDRDE